VSLRHCGPKADVAPHIPEPPTSFIGREAEIDDVRPLLT
jgi:hypothetical protein